MTNILCPSCGSENIIEDSTCKECSADLKLNNKYYLKKILGENVGITYLAELAQTNLQNLPKDEFLKNTVKLQLNNLNLNEATSPNETFVIKELSLRTVDKWKNAELFKREAEILSQLDHKAIPKLVEEFELGVARNAKSYIVMDYIDGVSLRDEFKTKRYTEETAVDTIMEIASILDYLHNLRPPIIHRDIKLSNIMRKKTGKLAIIDFGSVKNIVDSNATVSGTFGFMAPEQFKGNAVQASDFYGLGVILLVLLTRKEPEDMSDNGLDLNWKDKIYASDKIIYLLERLLDKDPNTRISNINEIYEIIKSDKLPENIKKEATTDLAVKETNALVDTNPLTEKHRNEFKRIDAKFLTMPPQSNYKAWKGRLDTILGLIMFGVGGAAWYEYTWLMGLAAGVGVVIMFMIITTSWYKREAKKFLGLFLKEIGREGDYNFTIAMLDYWAQKHGLGDEFLAELKKYEAHQVGLNLLDVQELTSYKHQISDNKEFERFTSTYMNQLHPDN